MSNLILETKAVGKSYISGRKPIRVLSGIDFAMESGAFISVQGESGSGKTTFLNILAGLESADEGSVYWDGQDVSKLGRDESSRRRGVLIGLVFQSYYLVPEMNAYENVMLGARIAGANGVSQSDVESMFAKVGLSERVRSMPNTLSGGERQRVAIARALITKPKVVLADEPTGNLDEKTGDSIMTLLSELCRDMGTGLILVTHNQRHAALADRQLHLKVGSFAEA